MFVAQGLVQVKQDKSGTKIFIDPVSEYKVCRNEKSYTLFVSDNGKDCLLLKTDKSLKMHDSIKMDNSMKDVLVQAAIRQAKVEIHVDKKYKITSLRVPAPPVKK